MSSLKRKNHFTWGIKLRKSRVQNIPQESNELTSPKSIVQNNFHNLSTSSSKKALLNPYQRFKRNFLSKKSKIQQGENYLVDPIQIKSSRLDVISNSMPSPAFNNKFPSRFDKQLTEVIEEIEEIESTDDNSEISQLVHLTRAAESAQKSRELNRIEEIPKDDEENEAEEEKIIVKSKISSQPQSTHPPSALLQTVERESNVQTSEDQIDDLLKKLTIHKQAPSQWTEIQINTDGAVIQNSDQQDQKLNQFEQYFTDLSNKRTNGKPFNYQNIVMKSTCQVANINIETRRNIPNAIPNSIILDPYSCLKLQDEMEKFSIKAKPNQSGYVMKLNSRELKKYFELLQIKLNYVFHFIYRDDEVGLVEFNFAFRDFIGHLNAVIASVTKYGWVIGFLAPFLMKGASSSQSCRLAFREACLIVSNICPYQLADPYLVDKLWSRAWFLLIDVAQTPNCRDARTAFETLQSMMATAPLSIDIIYKLIISRTLAGCNFYEKSYSEFRCMRVSLLEIICFRLIQAIEQRTVQPPFLALKGYYNGADLALELLEYCKNEFDMTYQGENDMVVLDMIKKSTAVSAIRNHKARMKKLQEFMKSPSIDFDSQSDRMVGYNDDSRQKFGSSFTKLLPHKPHRISKRNKPKLKTKGSSE